MGKLIFPRLYAPGTHLGYYDWSSHLTYLRSFARLDVTTLPRVLGAAYGGRVEWRNETEFWAWVAFFHELVHYLQDVSTGVGHFDFYVRQKHLSETLGKARLISLLPVHPDLHGGVLAEARALRRRITSLLVLKSDTRGEAREIARIEHYLRRGGETPELVSEDAPLLIPRNLLEAEAVLTMASTVLRANATDEAYAILREFKPQWHPSHMGATHAGTIDWMLRFVRAWFDVDGVSVDDPRTLEIILLAWQVMIGCLDLAFAHPSPRLLKKMRHQRMDHHPGVKLRRLWWAFHRFAAAETERALHHFFSGEIDAFEKMLFGGHAYIPSSDVYQDWAELFDGMVQAQDHRVAMLRRRTCERRLASPGECVFKGPSNYSWNQMAVFSVTDAGVQSFQSGLYLLRDEELEPLLFDILRDNSHERIVAKWEGAPRYRCPLAETHQCAAAVASCRSGFENMSDLPNAPGCHIREVLENAGFRMS